MADVTETAKKWYHKGWPPFLLGAVLGALVFAAPIALAYGWISRKVRGVLPSKQ